MVFIEPGLPNDTIRCRLEARESPQAAFPYEALSYEWGDEEHWEEIVCNNIRVSVRQNLARALRRFRTLPTESRDALTGEHLSEDSTNRYNDRSGLEANSNIWLGFAQRQQE